MPGRPSRSHLTTNNERVSLCTASILLVVLAGCSGPSKSAAPPTSTRRSTTTSTTAAPPTSAPTTTAPSTSAPSTSAPTTSPPPGPLDTVTIGQWTGSRPQTIWFSGDAGNIVTNISWSSWGSVSGSGEGTWHYDNCDPNCADGTETDYPASLIVSGASGGQFTSLEEIQSAPYGQTYTFTLPDRGLNGASSNGNFDQ
jgi:hypothetical protein